MRGKSSTLMVHFFTPYLPIAFTFLPMFFHDWKNFLKPLKCLSGHPECSFDNTAENCSPKVRKFLLKCVNIYKLIIFFKKFFPQKVFFREIVFFSKKSAFIPSKGIFNKIGGRKICRLVLIDDLNDKTNTASLTLSDFAFHFKSTSIRSCERAFVFWNWFLDLFKIPLLVSWYLLLPKGLDVDFSLSQM